MHNRTNNSTKSYFHICYQICVTVASTIYSKTSTHSDGTPKRTVGIFYPDINMVWKQDMIEADYVPTKSELQHLSKRVAITDKQFTADL